MDGVYSQIIELLVANFAHAQYIEISTQERVARMTADRKLAPRPFTLYAEMTSGRTLVTDFETSALAVVAAKTARKAGGYKHIFIRQYATEAHGSPTTIWEWTA